MLIVVLVHIDDCTIVGKSLVVVERFKTEIAKYVEITDMGGLHWILGIEVHHIWEDHKLLLSQKAYLESILPRKKLPLCNTSLITRPLVH